MFLLLCLVWGSSFILMKKASLVFGPVTIGAVRCTLAALALAAVLPLLRDAPRPRLSALPKLIVVAALGYAVPYAIQPYLVARHGSGFIGMMVSFVPLMTILVSIPLLGAFASRTQWLGVLAGLGCLGVVMADGLGRSVPASHLALALVVPLCYAVANTLVKRWFATASPVVLAAIGVGLAGAALAPLAGLLETLRPGPHLGLALGSLLVLGLLGTGLAVYLFYRLILDQGPLFAGMVTYVIPVGAVLWGWADAERVTPLQIGALVGVLGTVSLVQWDIARRAAAARR